MKVTVVGCGYVGLGVGLALAITGHEVLFLDVDEAKVARLEEGSTPFHEPGLEAALRATRGRTGYTTDSRRALDGSEVVLITAGTPPRADGSVDLTYLHQAVESLAQGVSSGGPLVALKSTVPVGTTRKIARLLGELRPAVAWRVAANPEFLRQGHILHDALYPDRIVLGADEPGTADDLERLYRKLIDRDFPRPPFLPGPERPERTVVIRTSPENAELAKYAANAFLAARVSLINEVANICDLLGADVAEVARVVGSDHRLGPHFLEAGVGYGGSCLPKDLAALCHMARQAGYIPHLLEAVAEVNEAQKRFVVRRLEESLGGLAGARVAVLGLAFKPGTADLRGAPSLDLIPLLLAEGAEVRAHDPVAAENARNVLPRGKVELCPTPQDALEGADAAVIVTDWPEYKTLDWRAARGRMRRPVVLDGRNALDPARMAEAGFLYRGVGRATGEMRAYPTIAGAMPE